MRSKDVKMTKALTSHNPLERYIYIIRGHKVMLDADLARIYGVETRILNQSVQRNLKRFPSDFLFKLTLKEVDSLRSQIVISNKGRGGRRYMPYALTEQGVAMLSSVLKSPRAIEVNIAIMRAFVSLRRRIAADPHLTKILLEHDRQIAGLTSHVQSIYHLIEKLSDGPLNPVKKIGFKTKKKK